MKHQFVSSLTPGQTVDDIFFIRQAETRNGKSGRNYLALKLSDSSGMVAARVWDQVCDMEQWLLADRFVRITGTVEQFRQELQIKVTQAQLVSPAALDQRDFLPSTYRDRQELVDFLLYFLTEVFDSDYRRLLEALFGDNDFMQRFQLAPGDVRYHHVFLGGLLEHTVAVTTLCQHAAVQHPRLNSDLLITAALLHDVGKVDEFTYEGRFRYSPEGKLLGHVLLGQRIIERYLRQLAPALPKEKELPLLHAVVSHHGELEWGAPKRPQSAEALVLHHLDNLDAKVKGFFETAAGKNELPLGELQNLFLRPLHQPQAADRERS